jgi:2'-deoxynucleoside 5'-phosphate N-hydrolase
MAKIYFAGAIRAGRDDVPTYRLLIDHLKQYGQVLTEHVGDYRLSLHGQTHLSDTEIHDRDLDWLHGCDVVVAEITVPSLGVGYEIAHAVAAKIPVLALYRGERSRVSAMIAGSPGVTTVAYADLPEAYHAIDTALVGVDR